MKVIQLCIALIMLSSCATTKKEGPPFAPDVIPQGKSAIYFIDLLPFSVVQLDTQ